MRERRARTGRGTVTGRIERDHRIPALHERRDKRRELGAATFPSVREQNRRPFTESPGTYFSRRAEAHGEWCALREDGLLAWRSRITARRHEQIGRHTRSDAG